VRNWERALIALLALVLLSLFGCMSLQKEAEQEPAKYKHDIIIIENTQRLPDEEFKREVEEFIASLRDVRITVKYDEAETIHAGRFIIRAWIRIPKKEGDDGKVLNISYHRLERRGVR
jgi:hypothetical protein